MESAFWDRVVAEGHKVPVDRSLTDLTTELTTMLGDPDPHRRDALAFEVLATWVAEGVYDHLLEGLGDGMASGLLVGIGQRDTDTVFRRSFSALVLAQCLGRDNEQHLLPPDTVLRWGDRLAGWLVREQDLRGFVEGKGWAHAIAHGADALGALAGSEAVGRLELTVLLDVIADRLLLDSDQRFLHGEDDRLAMATLEVLRRDLLGMEVLEPWVARLSGAARFDVDSPGDPYRVAGDVRAYLRALYLQLSLAPRPPAVRADLLLVLIEQLRLVDPYLRS
ncbi:DUF2785 domain-containing protein [Nocardioides mesophilus]|uniref:DUF2785 domain-containing protein n=1 Tax=Nocardioides mesophilus TaxID=433659 RepID=A0A7G9R8L2_9ACTN|nr:DUF2785 domain-containing protein [Nocardioides mesophilus]QNN51937.1 DUF2785 domain-containing protein [Nocardioides mesophilus]